jgi:uncharacterized protein YndB with AHSA1/START domain
MSRTPQQREHQATDGSREQHISISIDAPIEVVWSVFTDVEQWPTWTSSVTSVQLIDGPMRVGAQARIRQPKLPTVTWTVTEFHPGRSWTWQATSPGARTVATHRLTGDGSTTVARQSIAQNGPLGRIVGRLYRSLTARYLSLEAEGLKRRSEQLVSSHTVDSPAPESASIDTDLGA